jgi:hypothetical protein
MRSQSSRHFPAPSAGGASGSRKLTARLPSHTPLLLSSGSSPLVRHGGSRPEPSAPDEREGEVPLARVGAFFSAVTRVGENDNDHAL